jgi:hypothetical protein
MNITFNPKNWIDSARHNISILLYVLLGVVFIFAVFAAKRSIGIMQSAKANPLPLATAQVRINFGVYNQIMERRDRLSRFEPTPVVERNPFGLVEAKKPTAGQ